jgi:malate dehydrogenase (oxaloacetate-decarboxylating)(NADP+)
MSDKITFTKEEALDYHEFPTPGKLQVSAATAMATQRDLSLAYSPGVAVPVQAIADDPELSYRYTSRGNMVAVISRTAPRFWAWAIWARWPPSR